MIRTDLCVPARYAGLRVLYVEYRGNEPDSDGYVNALIANVHAGVTENPDEAGRFRGDEIANVISRLPNLGSVSRIEPRPIGLWCLTGEEYHEVAENLSRLLEVEWRAHG